MRIRNFNFVRRASLAATLVLTALTACGGGGVETTGGSSTPPAVTPAAPTQPTAINVATVALTPDSIETTLGTSKVFVAAVTGSDGSRLSGRRITWAVANPAIASVDTSGVVLGRGVGQTTITATVEGRIGVGKLTVVSLTTPPPAPVPVQFFLRPHPPVGSTPLPTGRSVQMTAYLYDRFRNDSVAVPKDSVEWSSSQPNNVAITASGLVTAWGGRSDIVAVYRGFRGTTTIITVQTVAVRLDLLPAALNLLQLDTATVVATVTDNFGGRLTGPTQWTSQNPSVATVTQGGTVRAMSIGSTTIQVKSSGLTAVLPVRVIGAASVASIVFTPASATLPLAGRTTLQVSVRDSSGAQLPIAPFVSLSSSNPAVATVSQPSNLQAAITVVGYGTTTISARVGTAQGTASIIVPTPPPPPPPAPTPPAPTPPTPTPPSPTPPTTGKKCSQLVSVASPGPGRSTDWIQLPFPSGLDVKIGIKSFNASVNQVPRYEHVVSYRNRYAQRIYFADRFSVTTVPTTTQAQHNVAANGTYSHELNYGPGSGTIYLYIANVRFGSFSAPAFCQ